MVGEGREAVVLPRRVAQTPAGTQAPLSAHIPAFPMGLLLLPMAADGSVPVELNPSEVPEHL